jgi:amino acid permease
MGKSTISNFMTILGLVNGMIGGTILILPILGESSGYINTLLICVSMGVI